LKYDLLTANSTTETRHDCQEGDDLASYAYTEHDGRSSAVQIIKDTVHNVEMKTEFLKVPGGEHGELIIGQSI
jgi:mannosyl-oligosaccharide glucosidase